MFLFYLYNQQISLQYPNFHHCILQPFHPCCAVSKEMYISSQPLTCQPAGNMLVLVSHNSSPSFYFLCTVLCTHPMEFWSQDYTFFHSIQSFNEERKKFSEPASMLIARWLLGCYWDSNFTQFIQNIRMALLRRLGISHRCKFLGRHSQKLNLKRKICTDLCNRHE